MTTFTRLYNRWTWALALIILTAAGLLPLTGILPIPAASLTAATAGAIFLPLLPLIWRRAGQGPLGHPLPHLLTATRGTAGVVLLVVAAFGAGGELPAPVFRWLTGAILALVETTDFFDGRLARRRGAAAFGSIWDMENDAFFTFALSWAGWVLLRLPVYVLVIGWMRYGYFVFARFQGDPPGEHRGFKRFAKTVAATLVITLITVHAPVVPRWLAVTAVSVALVLQIVSFGWDALLHLRSRAGSRG